MSTALQRWAVATLALTVTIGCEGKTDPAGAETDMGTQGITTLSGSGSTTQGTADATATTEQGTADGDSSASAEGPTSTSDTTEGPATTTAGGGGTTDCNGTIWACGDGEDNDGDGFIDLFDPECTGPCDDDEGSFQTGIPGDNMDCRQDCFFDGNSGQGDDGCIWDLRCDPSNPGEFIGCEYTGGNNCENQPPNQEQDCIEFCEPFVPPGCDCFGCCEIQTDEGSIWIFLNSHPDCALDNLDACSECTPQIDDCGVPCVPGECQLCFGETELPAGCDEVTCPAGGDPCVSNEDCPMDFFCYLDCCYPPPPG